MRRLITLLTALFVLASGAIITSTAAHAETYPQLERRIERNYGVPVNWVTRTPCGTTRGDGFWACYTRHYVWSKTKRDWVLKGEINVAGSRATANRYPTMARTVLYHELGHHKSYRKCPNGFSTRGRNKEAVTTAYAVLYTRLTAHDARTWLNSASGRYYTSADLRVAKKIHARNCF